MKKTSIATGGTFSPTRHTNLKSFALFLVLSMTGLALGICPLCCSRSDPFPVLEGPNLGQQPPGMTPQIFAPGIITTTDRNELNAVFSPTGDEFYFAVYTQKPIDTCVIMVSRRIEHRWSRPQPASFSGKGMDVDMAFGPDGNRLYFCSVGEGTKHDILVVSRQQNNTWSDPKKIGPLINTTEGETYPTFTQNGRMYFSAVRPEGLGGKDVYYSDIDKGTFTKPVNLGEGINSPHQEGDTFVAPDESYLIVSSAGRPDSRGGSDLYISFKQTSGTWTPPKNMGNTINTKMYEYSPMVSPDGKYLFFSRFYENKSDIYWVDIAIIEQFKSTESAGLFGSYLGQQPPGTVPELFAPGIVSKEGSRDLMHGFFDDDNLFILYRYPVDFKGDWTKEPLVLMKRLNGRWTAPYPSKLIGKPWIYNLESVGTGERVIFAWTKNIDGSGPSNELYLWSATKSSKGWNEPVRLPAPINTGFETWPSVSRDKTLYFFSRRKGGMGKFDIYQSVPQDGEYRQVQNLGDVINTPHIEEDPHIAPDGSFLLFDSNRPGGSGGFDLYVAWRKKDQSWTEPVNLGPTINTEHSECRAYLSADGKVLFFSSNRNGDFDTWWVSAKVIHDLRPERSSSSSP